MFTGTEKLSALLEAVAEFERGPRGSRPELKLAVLRNYTVEPILPYLKYHIYQSDLEPVVSVGEYDNIQQEVLDPTSHAYAPGTDLVLVSWALEHLDPTSRAGDWKADTARDKALGILGALAERSRSLVAVNTFLPPLYTESSLLAPARAAHRSREVARLNDALREFAARHSHQVFLVDWERMLAVLGEERALDYRFWYTTRAPFKNAFWSRYAWELTRLGRALKGRAKKVLVLDCDNTLWGGVVGELGVDGIKLDPFEYPGRCFYEFQQTVLNLIGQGVVVALNSKNNEADVLDVLDRHPHSLLRKQHLAAWRINWNDKASNIRELAAELNLGLDSFVFIDDSKFECEFVKGALPEVDVLEVPTALFDFPRLLFQYGLFDGLSVSTEDAARTQSYVAERERTQAQAQFASPEEYLRSLGLRAEIHRARENELTRVAQLIGKTNQFNLTTLRHSEAQVREFAASPNAAIFTLSAGDRYGDLGLVAVLIATREGDVGTIDTLLMSCRALGRRLELAFLEHCLSTLEKNWELTSWRASYVPTKKNAQVANFWDARGFSRVTDPEAAGPNHVYSQLVATRQREPVEFIEISGD